MTFKDLQMLSLNYYQQLDVKNHTLWQQPRHQTAALVSLEVQLANFAQATGLETGVVDNPQLAPRATQLEQFTKCLRTFFLFANLLNWNELCRPTDEQLTRLSNLTPDEPNTRATLYLMVNRLVLTAYYEKQATAFQHAWSLFLKWGLVDSGFSISQLTTTLQQQVAALQTPRAPENGR
ncbi:hypothetical protein M8332_03220 [Fructilactobacillus ixorae]|uniref:dUTPase n=1 Tax=Fructilactobacillus ixorae TaxID=1750535 RepID=A0ABY5C509_9LACO|nr:hypothetical protein [Fructilactobacillus ixorae]USS93860.1 hypothetical protein M8332_03220 [Fructilactobacillus ixorae]